LTALTVAPPDYDGARSGSGSERIVRLLRLTSGSLFGRNFRVLTNQVVRIDHTDLLTLSFQLDGVCTALRQCVGSGLKPGPGTLKSLRTLRGAFVGMHNGVSLDMLPNIDFGADPSDILTYAEILRSTVARFLSSDEIAEKRRANDFHSHEA
jgi:hypothetical protein